MAISCFLVLVCHQEASIYKKGVKRVYFCCNGSAGSVCLYALSGCFHLERGFWGMDQDFMALVLDKTIHHKYNLINKSLAY